MQYSFFVEYVQLSLYTHFAIIEVDLLLMRTCTEQENIGSGVEGFGNP